MNKPENSKFVSLAVKNAVFYIALIVLTSLLIGFFIYRISYNIVLHSSEQNAQHTLDILEVKMQSYIDNIGKDVLFIARSPYLKDYILAQRTQEEEIKKRNLEADYISFLASKPDYAQLRFIGLKEGGKEIIRVDRMNSNISIIGNQGLQEKGSSTYFKETINLPEDSVNYSIIDLNKEYGIISMPKMPTLRVSCPIWYKNESFGMAVINTNLNSLFTELNNIVKEEYELFLLNSKGQALIHPDTSKSFSFEYKNASSFFQDLNIDSSKSRSTSFTHQVVDDRYFFKRINYPRKNYDLVFCVKSKENKLLEQFYLWRWSILGITLMISALMMLLALWWLNKQAKSMHDIVSSMTAFEKDLKTKNLPVERNDEIGIIARRFETLAATINSNMNNLASAKREAEAANLQKEEFLQNMSHEIRNPLHTILGMTRMLEDNTPSKAQIPIIESLKFSSNALLSLVNDVLDFSKLKEGLISLTPKRTLLYELIEQIVRTYSYEANSRKITIHTQLDSKLIGAKFDIDSLRITQVLNNLLSNAIKFSPSKTQINIEVNVVQDSKDFSDIEFVINDQGSGIPLEKFDFILQRFQRLDDHSTDQEISGAGLGLPIVVQILKLFGSKLELKNKIEQGSIFSFRLKLTKSEIIESKDTIKSNIVQWTSMLLVEDDPQIIMLYKHIFSDEKVRLKIVSAIEDLELLDRNINYDALITDNYLNTESIVSHLDLVKSLISSNGIKVLITGDYNLVALISKSANFFDCILQKPVQPDRLIELIDRIWAWKSFKMINLSSLYSDYDFNKEKITNALNLLCFEWKNAKSRLMEAITNKDQKLKDAIVHKLANSLRRFELEELEIYWRNIDLSLIESENIELNNSIQQLENCIQYIEYQLATWNS